MLNLLLAVVMSVTMLAGCGNQNGSTGLADTVRIREVLVNILGNAVKFTDDGGTITFETCYHPGEASIDAGMNGHIAKPIDIDEVIKAIARNVKR